jgi:hypothetical protein
MYFRGSSERLRSLIRIRNIRELVQLAGAEEDPYTQEMLAWMSCPLGKGKHSEKFQSMLEQQLVPQALDSLLNPGEPAIPTLDAASSIVVGYAGNRECRVSLEGLSRGLIELGPMGAGKTTHVVWLALQLIQLGVKIFFMDHKNEARRLIGKLPGQVIVLRPSDLWFNLLEPIGDDAPAYYAAFAQELGAAFQLHPGTVMKVGETLRLLQRGTASGAPHASLQDLWRTLEYRAKQSKDSTFGTAAISLQNLEPILGRATRLRRNASSLDRFPIVALECMGLPPRVTRLLAGIFLNRLQHETRSRGHSQTGLERVYLSDEGSFEFSAQLADTDSTVYLSPQRKLFTQARSSRTCVMVGFQTLGQADPVVKGNAGTFICRRAVDAAEQREAARLLQLPEEQAFKLAALTPGHAYLRAPGYDRPVRFTFPRLDLGDYVSDGAVEFRMAPLIAEMLSAAEYAPPPAEETSLSYREILGEESLEPVNANGEEAAPTISASEIPTDAPLADWLEVLHVVRRLEPVPVTTLYKALGRSTGRGNRLQEEVLAHGLVVAGLKKLASKNGGRPQRLLSLTPKGHEFLAKFGTTEEGSPE